MQRIGHGAGQRKLVVVLELVKNLLLEVVELARRFDAVLDQALEEIDRVTRPPRLDEGFGA